MLPPIPKAAMLGEIRIVVETITKAATRTREIIIRSQNL
jgi:hypothetical protein